MCPVTAQPMGSFTHTAMPASETGKSTVLCEHLAVYPAPRVPLIGDTGGLYSQHSLVYKFKFSLQIPELYSALCSDPFQFYSLSSGH